MTRHAPPASAEPHAPLSAATATMTRTPADMPARAAPEIEVTRAAASILPAPPSPVAGLPSPAHRDKPVSATNTALTVRDFSAWYASFQALHNMHMDIPHCRVTSFIGPSGCGKSTFLRWINRMNDLIPIARAEGTLDLHGIDLLAKATDVVDLRRRVGMVFQKPNPFPKSIYDNVAFGPRLHFRIGRSDLDDLIEKALRAAALWDEVKDRLKSSALGLSGGLQQRL